MEKKKVLFISAANSIHTVKWVNALSNEFEIHLAYCKNHKPDINNINSDVILHEMHWNAPFGYYLNALELKKIYNNLKPDIVNVHYASGYGTLARISKLKNVLLSVWGSDVYDFPNESKIKKMILKKNVMSATEIASTSEIMAKRLKEQIPEFKKDIYITPFGVDVNKFKKIQEVKKEKYIIIGNVKTLKNSIYGIDCEILAVKRLIEKLKLDNQIQLSKSIKLYIYGDGEDKEKIQDLIKENTINDIVFLKGKVPNDNVPEILNNLDIFCITSNKESFGVSVIEAMACELPIVATDTDGFCEVMEDEITGYIVKKQNVELIAEALKKLVENKELRKQMGESGRKRVIEKYNWKNNVEIMSKIYKSMIKKE